MLVRFWGVRGSTPTPQAENLRYGGNTSCVEVGAGGSRYIFDCGTGLRALGQELVQETAGPRGDAPPFASRFLSDRTRGFSFFAHRSAAPGAQFGLLPPHAHRN